MSKDSFSFVNMSVEDTTKLQSIKGIEFSFERQSLAEELEDIYNAMEVFVIQNLLPKLPKDRFVFLMEGTSSPVTAVRSHIGLKNRLNHISEESYIAKEVRIAANASVFACIIDFNLAKTADIFDGILYQTEQSFLLSGLSKKEIFFESFLQRLVMNSLNNDESVFLNYASLLVDLVCNHGGLILRANGDGNSVAFAQLFFDSQVNIRALGLSSRHILDS